MALPIIKSWPNYFSQPHEGLGSSYERIILNNLLLKLSKNYRIKTVLEVPVFGFTGITGINSMALYKSGCDVTILDHVGERIDKINLVLQNLEAGITTQLVSSYLKLPYENGIFDMSWNFSAIWFVEDLSLFIKELTRVTGKIILICVPNQSGLGYKWQKANADVPHDIIFHEEYINPDLVKREMVTCNWHLVKEAYIDCPPWPDIGMSKEKFLRKYLSRFMSLKESLPPKHPISILDYYSGKDPCFAERMEKYSWLERHAPDIFKKHWAHHKWMLFEKRM